MPKAFREIDAFLKKEKDDIVRVLASLEEKLIVGRDDCRVPVYLTKYRVKSADSIYLKMKRREINDISKIPDLAGIRVLCLFNNDLIDVYNYILGAVLCDYKLTEIEIYNFDDEESDRFVNSQSLLHHKDKGFDVDYILKKNKDSGYKSIHFACEYSTTSGKVRVFEMQLRTLLQDVWGELEHSLAYKQGRVDQNIRKYFRWLHVDLENIASMLSEMKNEYEGERNLAAFMKVDKGPYAFFGYDKRLETSLLDEDPMVRAAFERYQKFGETRPKAEDIKKFAVELRRELETVYDAENSKGVKIRELGGRVRMKYWLDMEEAYCLFCEGQLRRSLALYNNIIDAGSCNGLGRNYVPYFRVGEIHFIEGRIIDALRFFDVAEEIIELNKGDEAEDTVNLNMYRIKVKLAHIYWQLGDDYLPISNKLIREADELSKSITHRLGDKDFEALHNNMCWYMLENVIKIQNKWLNPGPHTSKQDQTDLLGRLDEELEALNSKFFCLKPYLESEDTSANSLDTAAWYHFNMYRYYTKLLRQSEATTALKKAEGYFKKMLTKKDRATLQVEATLLRTQHVRELADECERANG